MERSGVTRRERGSGTARPPSPLSADSTGRLPGGLSAHCFLADPTRIWPGSPQRPPSPRRAGPAGPQESRSAPAPDEDAQGGRSDHRDAGEGRPGHSGRDASARDGRVCGSSSLLDFGPTAGTMTAVVPPRGDKSEGENRRGLATGNASVPADGADRSPEHPAATLPPDLSSCEITHRLVLERF